MPVRTHYDVLGVAADASAPIIREAYRRLAREHHPDRSVMSSAAGGARDMPAINEAYRVLQDPGRRAMYDRAVRAAAGSQSARSPTPRSTGARPFAEDDEAARMHSASFHHHDGPARVPWRMLLLSGLIGISGVVVLAQFTGAGEQVGPDGILRNGDCVEIQANNDAREVTCSGVVDLVVRAFVPFDGTCPGQSVPHRDRQGMGVACVQLEDHSDDAG